MKKKKKMARQNRQMDLCVERFVWHIPVYESVKLKYEKKIPQWNEK